MVLMLFFIFSINNKIMIKLYMQHNSLKSLWTPHDVECDIKYSINSSIYLVYNELLKFNNITSDTSLLTVK